MRTAIELAFLGAKVVLLEKRDAFSRNNVLHLWPFTIQDLRGLCAKKFYGKFCAGAIDHISECRTCVDLLLVPHGDSCSMMFPYASQKRYLYGGLLVVYWVQHWFLVLRWHLEISLYWSAGDKIILL